MGLVNSQQPVQLMRIGNLGLIAIPGEPTTMVGRHLRQAVNKELASAGVDTLVIAGLANNYSGYVTTRAEYAQQHYEGASTEFGPHQASAYEQEYVQLAQAMRDGTQVTSEVSPPDRSAKRFAQRPGVTFDDKPANQAWGQVLTQPKDRYRHNEIVTVTFRGAHPKNNLRTEDTFLKVQRLAQGWSFEVISDLGSGMNYHKKGLKRLLDDILDNKIDRLVLTHKDRLLRFGAELVFALCEARQVEVVIINQGENLSFEEELAQDVLEIITVFSARLYGSPSKKNKKLIEAVKASLE